MSLPGVMVREQPRHADKRGVFQEVHRNEYPFVQTNLIESLYGVFRGFHYRVTGDQGKLVQSVSGRHVSFAVDVRKGSPTVGQYHAERLEYGRQLYVPPGFAHGLLCTSISGVAMYSTTQLYDPDLECVISYEAFDIKLLHWLVGSHLRRSPRDETGFKSLEEFWRSLDG